MVGSKEEDREDKVVLERSEDKEECKEDSKVVSKEG